MRREMCKARGQVRLRTAGMGEAGVRGDVKSSQTERVLGHIARAMRQTVKSICSPPLLKKENYLGSSKVEGIATSLHWTRGQRRRLFPKDGRRTCNERPARRLSPQQVPRGTWIDRQTDRDRRPAQKNTLNLDLYCSLASGIDSTWW